MAIDSLRKRASVASLGLAFLGPSVVPDGSFVQADRQVIANSYYGILAGSAFVTIGGTSQLEPFTATGGITLERVIGGTSQLEPFTASGGITLERTLGGTSQLNPFTSSGGIQVGDAVEEPVDVAHGRGGGGNVGILYKGFKLPDVVEAFQIDDTQNPTPTFASEIERRNAAIRSLAEQIKTVEQETQQLRQTEDLNNQIRAEELALDTFHVEQFIERLAIDMQELRQEKRRREEEELITILLNSWNVKIH